MEPSCAARRFRGLDPHKPVTVYVRHMPHWRQDGATYFVTFRLADSLPQAKLRELDRVRHEWELRHPPPQTDEQLEQLAREIGDRIERWLDQGMGSCHLRNVEATKQITDAMHHFDGDRYELGCHVVMPNHVHAVVRPLLCDAEPLERILQSWKRHAALKINRALDLSGQLWQHESFDRIIRDEEHLYRVIQYIGGNPSKAGLDAKKCSLWIRPEWERLGWRFEKLSQTP